MMQRKRLAGISGFGIVIIGVCMLVFLTAPVPAQNAEALKKPVVYSVPGMDSVKIYRDIIYKTGEDGGLPMDIYTPPGLSGETRLPVVILIHGGYLPKEMGLKPKDWGVFVSYGKMMAASGFVGVTFNYRYYGWDEANLDQAFADVADAIRFVREQAGAYHIDPDRVGLWVFSGGGLLLSLPLREKMGFVRGLVSYYAILDLEASGMPGVVIPGKEKAKTYSPIEYLTEDNAAVPPIFIGRAGLDNSSLNQAADRFIAKALALNKNIEVLNHPGGHHGFDIRDDVERSREIIARTILFLQTCFKK